MELIRSALGHHLDARPDGIIEVDSLSCDANLNFLDTLDRRGHHAGRGAVRLGSAGAYGVLLIASGITRHVVGVVAAVDRVGILIGVGSRGITVGSYSRL